jgi:hypothetical protein
MDALDAFLATVTGSATAVLCNTCQEWTPPIPTRTLRPLHRHQGR